MNNIVNHCRKEMQNMTKQFTKEKYKMANEYLKLCCLTSNK